MPLTERDFIRKLRRSVSRLGNEVVVRGIGDDCAVLRPPRGAELVVTTDFSLEGVHFRRDWHPAESAGHRCLARGLSDIAAMGAEPVAAFLSLAMPADLPQKWADDFLAGFSKLAKKWNVPLAGGDTAQSPGPQVLADIMVIGSIPKGRAVPRSGARVGDDIYVTGLLGESAAEVRRFAGVRKTGSTVERVPSAQRRSRHYFPQPRIDVAQFLREKKIASAMIDISDGISVDLAHICEESGVGAWIAEAAVPFHPTATVELALHGGEDYELLFTAPPEKAKLIPAEVERVPITYIGTVVKGNRVWIVDPEMKSRRPLEPRGWQHFSSR